MSFSSPEHSVWFDLDQTVSRLRVMGTDYEAVEVKSAREGTPNLVSALCSFGNMPECGVIILGLDEGQGFIPFGLSTGQLAALRAGVASQARDCLTPPVQVEFSDGMVENQPVFITPLALADKPCRVKAGEKPIYSRLTATTPCRSRKSRN